MKPHTVGPSTERLDHRALLEEDAEAFFALNSHPEVMRWTVEPPLESVEAARLAIAHYPDFETVGYGRWGCFLRDTQTLVGFHTLGLEEIIGLVLQDSTASIRVLEKCGLHRDGEVTFDGEHALRYVTLR